MERPTWLPQSFDTAKAEIESQYVVENHYTELKQTYEQTGSGTKEMAKDIAALALDGGALIIGVVEDAQGRAVDTAPVELAQFAERIDQVALHRCDPPVTVQIHLLEESDGASTGLLVVEVPPHSLRPVMVDGRYFGRGERTVRQLADAEVVRLHQARAGEDQNVNRALETAVDHAKLALPLDSQQVGTLVIVAEPSPVIRTDLMADVYGRHDWWRWQQTADQAAASFVREQDSKSPILARSLIDTPSFSPLQHLRGGTSHDRQPEGVRVHGGLRGSTNGPRGYLQLHESGALHLAIDTVTRWENRQRVLQWYFVLTTSVYMVGLYNQVCRESGLLSAVDFGVHLSNLRDVVPQKPVDANDAFVRDRLSSYQATTYQHTTRITTPELAGDLTAAMERLWGPLLRAFGLGDRLRNSG